MTQQNNYGESFTIFFFSGEKQICGIYVILFTWTKLISYYPVNNALGWVVFPFVFVGGVARGDIIPPPQHKRMR